MHPFRIPYQQAHNDTRADKPVPVKLCSVPPVKNTQLKCALTGGFVPITNTKLPVLEKADGNIEEKVQVIFVSRCPVCKKISKKEIRELTISENNSYYHTFVENNLPGVLLYEPCDKHSSKLSVIK